MESIVDSNGKFQDSLSPEQLDKKDETDWPMEARWL